MGITTTTTMTVPALAPRLANPREPAAPTQQQPTTTATTTIPSSSLSPSSSRLTLAAGGGVLCLGLPRTGTLSMKAALHMLGHDRILHGFDHGGAAAGWVPWQRAAWANLPYLRDGFDDGDDGGDDSRSGGGGGGGGRRRRNNRRGRRGRRQPPPWVLSEESSSSSSSSASVTWSSSFSSSSSSSSSVSSSSSSSSSSPPPRLLLPSPYTRADWDRLFGATHQGVMELGSVFAADLIRAYPGARVILWRRHRDRAAWARSFDRHLLRDYFSRPLGRGLLWLEGWAPGVVAGIGGENVGALWDLCRGWVGGGGEARGFMMYDDGYEDGDDDDDDDDVRRMRERLLRREEEHYEMVKRLVPKERLLEYRMGEDGWEPLCEFLGVEKPKEGTPFPHVNDGEAMSRATEMMFQRLLKRLLWLLMGYLLGAVVVLVVLVKVAVGVDVLPWCVTDAHSLVPIYVQGLVSS